MRPVIAVLDACVLHSAFLRNLFMYLAVHDVFRPKWTEDIHEEWIESVRERRPDIPLERLEETRRLMDEHARDSLIEGYDDLITTIDLPDPDDRHVLAAAIIAKADCIVTFNVRDFPGDRTSRFGIGVDAPDNFLLQILLDSPDEFCAAVKAHRTSLKNPPIQLPKYLKHLRQLRLVETAKALRPFGELL